MPGPIGKRDEERRRRNKPVIETMTVDLDEVLRGEVEIPAPPMKTHDKDGNELAEPKHLWHPTAELAYRSLAKSGQAIFYEPSDWALAYTMCEALSRELNPKPILVQLSNGESEIQWISSPVNGAVVGNFLKAWASLMASEGDRRRLKIELNREKLREQQAGGGNVASITQNRQDVFSS